MSMEVHGSADAGAGGRSEIRPDFQPDFTFDDMGIAGAASGRRRRSRRPRPTLRTAGCGGGVGGRAAPCEGATGNDVHLETPESDRRPGRRKNGLWTDAALEKAMDAVTDDGMPIKAASRTFGVPCSSLRDHLYGKSTCRQRGIKPTLNRVEEKKLVQYIFQMQDLGHPLTPTELRLKVAQATQARSTPWAESGVPGRGWLRRFRVRHPELATRRSQGLEVARARALCPATAETLYSNLEYLYGIHNYPAGHIWNCDESGVQAGRSGGATVLAKRGSRSVHSIEPDQREHLSVLSCVNADGRSIPNFYILKGCYFLADYIARCEEGAVMGMQRNAWMTRWLFESWISHFIQCLRRGPGLDQNTRHLLILDGHNSHVSLEVVKISMENGLDIVSLPSHTSHGLQPLDVACFKPFKTAFRKERDLWTLQNKNRVVEKQDLCEWTSKALKAALTPSNVKARFRRTGIWPFNRNACTSAMGAANGFSQVEDSLDEEPVTGSSGHGTDCTTGPAGAPSGRQLPTTGGAGNAHRVADVVVDREAVDSDVESWASLASDEDQHSENEEFAPSDARNGVPHYFVHIVDAPESTYDASERNISIDQDFHEQLQQEGETEDISRFLALPEIIPARKRKRQQPLLDFTKSKILTSTAYTEGCERLLAQRNARSDEARRKAEQREASKEQRRKEKEEREVQVQLRKQAREAKRLERQREEEERRQRGPARSGRRRPSSLPSGTSAHEVPGAPSCDPPPAIPPAPPAPPSRLTAEAADAANPHAASAMRWPDHYHPNSAFAFNPQLHLQHPFPYPTGFNDHNGHLGWISQSSRAGGSDVSRGLEVPPVRVLTPEMPPSGSHRHVMPTWQGSAWGL